MCWIPIFWHRTGHTVLWIGASVWGDEGGDTKTGNPIADDWICADLSKAGNHWDGLKPLDAAVMMLLPSQVTGSSSTGDLSPPEVVALHNGVLHFYLHFN
jgi:hypothetical protein